MKLEQKIKLLDQANIECQWGNPKSQTINTPNWAQIITPEAKHSSANCVFRSILSSAEVIGKVDQTTDFYENLKVPFRWLVTPLTQPLNTQDHLLKKGLSLYYEATGMMSSVNEQLKPYDYSISVIPINFDNLEIYIQTFVRSWQLPSHQISEFKEDVRYALVSTKGRFLPFVAYFKNEPVGTCALLNLPSGCYLAAGTVEEKFRGQGIYKAMVSHRAKVAKELESNNLLIHAKKLTAAPICKRLGFEEVYDYKVFSKEL